MINQDIEKRLQEREPSWVRLEISAERLSRLLETSQLCAADFRCLDCESRCCVRNLCRRNCSRYLAKVLPKLAG
ncbi:hypothetical protein JYT26_00030 [Beggiatoa alba]|nr:hypothetical protein [Beggiatoa alba]